MMGVLGFTTPTHINIVRADVDLPLPPVSTLIDCHPATSACSSAGGSRSAKYDGVVCCPDGTAGLALCKC